jgi:ParB family chromosome partitioning protein
MSRSSLGRGLAAIIPDHVFDDDTFGTNADGSASALRLVEVDRIKPNPEQPRMTFSGQALEQLAESVRTHGVLTPLLVRRNDRGPGFVLIAGERRLRAAGLAGLERVPCWVREHLSSREQLELALVENIQREDLDPIETAESYNRLVTEFGLTQAEVARRVGKDRATVANAIRLLRLPQRALAEVRDGRISAGHGKALLGLADDQQLLRILSEVITKDLSVRATERLVASLVRPKGQKARRPSPAMVKLSDRLSRALGSKVKVEPRARGEKGRIVIDYASKEELETLVKVLAAS